MAREKFVWNFFRVTVMTVKIRPSDFTVLLSPEVEKAFCNADLSGDGKFWGDDRNAKRVTVNLRSD